MNKLNKSRGWIWLIGIIIVSIFPGFQVILLNLNGEFTYLFGIPFAIRTNSNVAEYSSLIVNFILLTTSIIVTFQTIKKYVFFTCAFLISFSGQMLMVHLTDSYSGMGNYLYDWLLISIAPSVSILAIYLYRRRNKRFN